MTARQQLKEGKITEEDYLVEYGKHLERIRILDILTENLPAVMVTELRKQIKEK